jgi:hypothetical protein
MSYKGVAGDLLITLRARGPGTYTSNNFFNPDLALDKGFFLLIYVDSVTGSPSLICSTETSTDGVTWTALSGSQTPALTGIGYTIAGAASSAEYVRINSTVTGSGSPTITYLVSVLAIGAV